MYFKNLPIGVIDSGIGGLNVLYKLKCNFKNESFIYFGDNDNAPYGNKPIGVLKDRINEVLNFFSKQEIKGLVIACNTVSTTLLDYIKSKVNYFVVPTYPPMPIDKNTYLACTNNTSKSELATSLYKDKIVPFKNLAEVIENNVFNLDNVDFSLYFNKIPKQATSLALGCTHYSYIENLFTKNLNVKVYDGYDKVISEVCSNLKNLKAKQKLHTVTFVGSCKNYNKKVFNEVILKPKVVT